MKHNLFKQLPNETKRMVVYLLGVLLVAAILGIVSRQIDYLKLRRLTKQQALLPVATVKGNPEHTYEEIVLPGNVAAWHEATLYARTNGYVSEWKTDIGARVKEGDVLATIATPEVDAELRQAEADLKKAGANYALAKSTAERWELLLKTNSVSKQETDEKTSDALAKEAIVSATRANRDRLLDLVGFQKIIAPFNGIIMARNTDIGKLVNAGSGTQKPLFRIVQAHPLRIYVRVPQIYAPRIKSSLTANLYFTEHPGKVYRAKLLDTANAIDTNTKTLLIQFVVANQRYDILPGGYTQVHLIVPTDKKFVIIPANTLLFRADGLNVATVDSKNIVTLKTITIGRDFGNTVEVVAGITAKDNIILNPPDSILTNQQVHVIKDGLLAASDGETDT